MCLGSQLVDQEKLRSNKWSHWLAPWVPFNALTLLIGPQNCVQLFPEVLFWETQLIRVRSKTQSTKFKHFSRTSKDPNCIFSSTKIIDKKLYPRRWHSKFRLQCDTEMYCTVLTNTVMIKAKLQNLQDLNSRTFQLLSSTLSVFKYFQGPWSFYSKFKHFRGFLKHAMNPVYLVNWRSRGRGT